MAITRELLEQTFKEMGLGFETDGKEFVHATPGNYAPVLQSVVSMDEDKMGLTMMTALTGEIAEAKRPVVCELLNLVHGQNLWNVRFHLDESGRVFSVGKHLLWGKPFNSVQFGDIFFTLLVTTDRLYPCLHAITDDGMSAKDAFERFFGSQNAPS